VSDTADQRITGTPGPPDGPGQRAFTDRPRGDAEQAGWEVPPWERPGGFRLDCEPHRGPLLLWLGRFSRGCGLLFTVPCLFGLSGLIGLPLGLTVWLLARRDLDRMQKGLLDPRGERETRQAWDYGWDGLVLSASGLLGWGVCLLAVWWVLHWPRWP
jgi:hypothetical protein